MEVGGIAEADEQRHNGKENQSQVIVISKNYRTLPQAKHAAYDRYRQSDGNCNFRCSQPLLQLMFLCFV
jgi:hypothetical protein